MKKEDLQENRVYSGGYTRQIQKTETLLEKFTYWFRDFLDSAE